ncbi:MAG: response regulator [Polyangiaceae bacterium]
MKPKIIVVDDSPGERRLVTTVLTTAGYEVVEATNGPDGLVRIHEHPNARLVLCDLNMPDMTGLTMVSLLPAAIRGRHVFVMLTTEASPNLVKRAKELGVRGWIVKPFVPEALLAAVARAVLEGERLQGSSV